MDKEKRGALQLYNTELTMYLLLQYELSLLPLKTTSVPQILR